MEDYLNKCFPSGLTYNKAAQLCLQLYCSLENVPEELHQECNKDGLAEMFASLSKNGFLQDEPISAAFYGANFHNVTDKGHWIEIIASIFKNGNTVDSEMGKELASCLTSL